MQGYASICCLALVVYQTPTMGLAATPHLLSPRPLPPAPQQAICIEDWLPSLYKLTSPKRQCRRELSVSQVPVPQLAAVLSASPVSHEPVSPRSAFDDIVCAECTRGDEPEGNAILLCDGLLPAGDCDFACHQLCLPSPLDGVPEGEWLCPSCTIAEQAGCRRGVAGPVTSLRVGPCFQASVPDCVLPPMSSATRDVPAVSPTEQDERSGTLLWSPRAEFAS